MTPIYEKKKLTNTFVEIHHFTEAATKGVLQKRYP